MKKIPGCTLMTLVLFLRDWKVSSPIQFVAKLEGWRCQSTSASPINIRLALTLLCPNHLGNLTKVLHMYLCPKQAKSNKSPPCTVRGPLTRGEVPFSCGSSWLPFSMTQPMPTSLPGQAEAWSSS